MTSQRSSAARLSAGLIVLAIAAAASPAGSQMRLVPGSPHVFTLTTYASAFPSTLTVGPLGVAFVPGATQDDNFVLVTDYFTSAIYRFPSHADGQTVGDPGVVLNTTNGPGDGNAHEFAQLLFGGTWKYYLTQVNHGTVIEVDGTGTPVPGGPIATIPGACGIAPFPLEIARAGFSGHLFVTDYLGGNVWNVDPVTRTTTLFKFVGGAPDGLSFSQDGNTLYVADNGNGLVKVVDVASGSITTPFPPIAGPDGVASGRGTLSGYIYVNYNNGDVWEFGEPGGPYAGDNHMIATAGSRGDFIATDTNVFCAGGFPSMLLTQTDSLVRLCSAGGGFFGPPTSSTLPVLDCGADGTPCDDGNPCTTNETCQSGSCVGSVAPNGTACDDGNACTQTDTCQSGTCTGSNPVICTALDPCHDSGVCYTGTGVCSNPAKPDGTACDDGIVCTQTDACQAGVCVGTAISCDDGNPCTDDACAPAFNFAPKTDFATGGGPIAVAIGDVNGDGKLDLVAANYGSNTVSVLLGNGAGGFGPQADFTTGNRPASVAIGDVNGDGKPDLAVANSYSNTVSVLLGNGAGGFGPTIDFATGTYPESVAIGDVNGDGKPDLAVANYLSNTVSVLLGDGAGGFGPTIDFATGSGPYSVAIGDVNGDGKLDLVAANNDSNTVSVLLGNGAGGFDPATDFATGSGPVSVAIGDVSGDGKPDLAVANYLSYTVSVLLGNGAGGFGPTTDFATGSYPVSVAIGDVNGDGKPDLAAANLYSNTVSVLLGNGAGGFGPTIEFATGTYPESVAIGDVNGDGKPDLVAPTYGSSTVSVLLNLSGPSCLHTNNTAACTDGNACTAGDTCNSGSCQPGTPVVCAALFQCHDAGTCDPGTGVCSNPAKPDGTACNDANSCTTLDACTGGVCAGTLIAPSEVDNGVLLSRSGSNAVINWDLAAGATSSDVIRGLVAGLPAGPGGGDESCLAPDTALLTASDPDLPTSGNAFWYLVRGRSTCGNGPYGFQGVHGAPGAPRASTTCP